MTKKILPGVLDSISRGYTVEKSLRFDEARSSYLSRTPGAGNRKTWTFSAWIKRSKISNSTYDMDLFSASWNTSYFTAHLQFGADDTIGIYDWGPSGSMIYSLYSSNSAQYFRDPTAWYHIVYAFDTTQATESNRVKIWVNNQQVTLNGTWPSQNLDGGINLAQIHGLGAGIGSGGIAKYFTGYMAEVIFADGQSLTPSSFGQTNQVTGVWSPKKYVGSYGTNGFYLNFKNPASTTTIGYDVSGNNNHFSSTNMSVTAGTNYDVYPDSPTISSSVSDTGLGGQVIGNYCTWNNVDKTMSGVQPTFRNGGIEVAEATSAGGDGRGTMFMTSGKWYYESIASGVTSGSHLMGINIANERRNAYSGVYRSNGDVYDLATTANIVNRGAYTNNDIIGIAYDIDNGKAWFRKNGTWLTGDPASGTTPTFTFTPNIPITPYFAFDNILISKIWYTNFGQRSYTYAAPSGFKSLCTANFSNPNILKPRLYHDTALYTGNGINSPNSLVISGYGFQPDFTWIKRRDVTAENHILQDSARGLGYFMNSNTTGADQLTGGGDVSSYNADGFTVSYANARTNANGGTYAAWMWKEAGQAGFDAVTYTAPSAGATSNISHNLGDTPKFIITKSRSSAAFNWSVYVNGVTANNQWLRLNTTDAIQTSGTGNTIWGSHNNSTFGVVGDGAVVAGTQCIAYLWSEIPGYSKFGSYPGNNSTDGVYVHLGFKPAWILIKRYDVGSDYWNLMDSRRDPNFNYADNRLYPNYTNADETGGVVVDFLSTGIKIRDTNTNNNASGSYMYAAFAETPFKYGLAR
jgi:hypothetical protein